MNRLLLASALSMASSICLAGEDLELFPELSAAEELEAYGLGLEVVAVDSQLRFTRVVATHADATDSSEPTRFIMYFTSARTKLPADSWRTDFCTPELRAIMAERNIDSVIGKVLAPGMDVGDPGATTSDCAR